MTGAVAAEPGLVFTPGGRHRHPPDYVLRAFQPTARGAGLPPIAFQRSSVVTPRAACEWGRTATMSKRRGHGSVPIAGDIYAPVVVELDRDAPGRTAGLFVPQAASR